MFFTIFQILQYQQKEVVFQISMQMKLKVLKFLSPH